ncbi:MAG: glycosyltransferase family 2 protein [Arenimonas sp.]
MIAAANPGRRPTFAAVLGVKDEVEILEDCIAHLRAIGVGHIFAHDAGSSDGSERILRAHEGADFSVIEHSDMDPDAQAWNRLHADLARDSGADWVLYLDADEFWLPRGGHLANCRALAEADIVTVPRYNVALGPSGPRIEGARTPYLGGDMQLVVNAPARFRAALEEDPSLAWIRGVPVPKVIARPAAIGGVKDGDHDVVPPPGATARRAVADDMVIAHLPFSTLARFARKIDNVRRVFDVHDEYFGAQLAWHWRRWLALEGDEAIAAEFDRQVFDESALATLRASGHVRSRDELIAAAVAARHVG